MTTIRFRNYQDLSAYAANEIANAIKEKPALTLCMASGHTPALTAELLAKQLLDEKIDYSQITFLGLDEWVGLPPASEGSCHYFFKTKLFEPLQLHPSQCFLFDAMANDLEAECKKKWTASLQAKEALISCWWALASTGILVLMNRALLSTNYATLQSWMIQLKQ